MKEEEVTWLREQERLKDHSASDRKHKMVTEPREKKILTSIAETLYESD